MAFKTSNPAPVVTAAGLGNVVSLAARDIREIAAPLLVVQIAYLTRRFGLPADRARLVADLAYGGPR